MKQLILLIIIVAFTGFAATAQAVGPEAISMKIAQKMKDTLSLSSAQQDSIYAINLGIHEHKAVAWQQVTDTDSLTVRVQRIENTRDSLYRQVLTTGQFDLYRTKKRNLVNNN